MFRIKQQVWDQSKQQYVDLPLDDCPPEFIELSRLMSRHKLSEAEVKRYLRHISNA